jgi:hypothetical protein
VLHSLISLEECKLRKCCTFSACEGGFAPFNPPKNQGKGELKMNKDLYFSFRVSEEEKIKIDKKIEKSKLKKSDFLRKMVLGKEIIVVDGLKELAMELNRIGNNINQISKAVNQGKVNDTGELSKLKESYEKAFDEVLKLSKKV